MSPKAEILIFPESLSASVNAVGREEWSDTISWIAPLWRFIQICLHLSEVQQPSGDAGSADASPLGALHPADTVNIIIVTTSSLANAKPKVVVIVIFEGLHNVGSAAEVGTGASYTPVRLLHLPVSVSKPMHPFKVV